MGVEKHVVGLKAGSVSARYHAAEALADLGPQAYKAHLALQNVLLRDESSIVRKSAALALGLIGAREAEGCLTRAAERDECQYVRQRSQDALMQLGVLDSCITTM